MKTFTPAKPIPLTKGVPRLVALLSILALLLLAVSLDTADRAVMRAQGAGLDKTRENLPLPAAVNSRRPSDSEGWEQIQIEERAPSAGTSAARLGAARTEPAASADDEVILLTASGQIRVDDPFTAPGYRPVIWNSGTDQGWTMVAAGDFSGDGDAEIVANRGDTIKAFDPFVQPGMPPVAFERSLGAGRNILLLVTGDFEGDGRDEIAFVHADPGGVFPYKLVVFDGGTNATAGEWATSHQGSQTVAWQDMAAGDVNNDGADDLVTARNADRGIKIYSGRTWATLVEQSEYATDWYAVATGNLSSAFPGTEIALERQGMSGQVNSLFLLRVLGNALVGLGGDYKYNPDFTSLGTGDLNGDGDDEVLMLRNPIVPKTSLLMINPAGVAMRSFEAATGSAAPLFTIVRTGDVDGDGRAEVIIGRVDRYRIYVEPQVDDRYTDYVGTFYTAVTVSNLPTLAVANIDGPGMPLGPVLSVSPRSLSFDLTYLEPSSTQTVYITNAGSSDVLSWEAQVIEGAAWLKLARTTGTTPDSLGVSVDTGAVSPGAYTGRIRINATSGGGTVQNSPQDVIVNLTLRPPSPTPTPTPTSTATASPIPTATSMHTPRPGLYLPLIMR